MCREIRKRNDHAVPVIMFWAMFDRMKQRKDDRADDFVPKGANLTTLADMLKQHIKIEREVRDGGLEEESTSETLALECTNKRDK